jgi:hypothetical protein
VLTSLDPWTIEHGPVSTVVNQLALEHTSILKAQVENIATSTIRNRIKLNHERLAAGFPKQEVADAPKVALTTVKTAHASNSLFLRHFDQLPTRAMQRVHLMPRNQT